MIIGMLSLMTAPAFANGPLLIGVNQEGSEVVYRADREVLLKEFQKANQQKFEVLNESLEKMNPKSSFVLKKVSLGLALEGEAGIGPWNLGLAIKHRLILAKEK